MPPIEAIAVILAVILILGVLGVVALRNLIYICSPNEVLIFSGRKRRVGDRYYGFRVVKGGRGTRIPLIERVDRMDLTNMVIDVSAVGAYSRGGIPLTVQGVANVKVAGHEPLLNHAIERFLGKTRPEIMQIAKATLEGSLRGVLATMSPEQVNEDKLLFAERLVNDVEPDMTALGLVVDTMKIQMVSDEVKYLDSLGRKKNAEVVSKARIAEAMAQADSIVRSAENLERETRAQVEAQMRTAKAEADRRLVDIKSRRDALVAEQLSEVAALVARAKSDLAVQAARVEQVRRQLEADVVQPARATADAAVAQARAEVAPILEEGRARAEALRAVAATIKQAGPQGRELLLLQKLPSVISAMTDVVAETHVERVTLIDSGSNGSSDGGSLPIKAISTLEQIKQLFGIDLVEKLQSLGGSPAKAIPATTTAGPVVEVAPTTAAPVAPAASPQAAPPTPRAKKGPRIIEVKKIDGQPGFEVSG